MNPENKPTCGGCKCRMMMPIALIIFAVSALLANYGSISWQTYGTIWPILVILVACSKMCKCRNNCAPKA